MTRAHFLEVHSVQIVKGCWKPCQEVGDMVLTLHISHKVPNYIYSNLQDMSERCNRLPLPLVQRQRDLHDPRALRLPHLHR
jgi:hypothetical protein